MMVFLAGVAIELLLCQQSIESDQFYLKFLLQNRQIQFEYRYRAFCIFLTPFHLSKLRNQSEEQRGIVVSAEHTAVFK